MRLRNKNWTKEYLEVHQEKLINYLPDQKVILANEFNNANQNFELEIGCGKGQFMLQQALKNPQTNFIGMEKERTVVGVALKKLVTASENHHQEISNLKFMNSFAENLTTMFDPESFTKIYLNFSDPWPKSKHHKKRLTYKTFLDQYFVILKPDGIIEIKTDNDNLYEFSLEQINEHPGFEITFQTTDLYENPANLVDNIPTEYEQKFHDLGKNINKIVLKKVNK